MKTTWYECVSVDESRRRKRSRRLGPDLLVFRHGRDLVGFAVAVKVVPALKSSVVSVLDLLHACTHVKRRASDRPHYVHYQ